jgi:hypothetical protein
VFVIRQSFVARVVDGQIAADPYLYVSVLVDADLILFYYKVFGVLVYFVIAVEGCGEHVQVFRKGDIFDFAESNFGVFDVYPRSIILGADGADFIFYYEFGVDDVRLFVAPVEGFEVVEVLFLIGPHEFVLVYPFAGPDVLEGAHQSVLLGDWAGVVEVLPFGGVVGGGLDLDGLFQAH